jgi:hypothetical protein
MGFKPKALRLLGISAATSPKVLTFVRHAAGGILSLK